MDAKHRSTAEDLLAIRQSARKAGADFPTIWDGTLRRHNLVIGSPAQVTVADKVALSVQLLDGRQVFLAKTDSVWADPSAPLNC